MILKKGNDIVDNIHIGMPPALRLSDLLRVATTLFDEIIYV